MFKQQALNVNVNTIHFIFGMLHICQAKVQGYWCYRLKFFRMMTQPMKRRITINVSEVYVTACHQLFPYETFI
jgi:hypothetical protein